MFGYNQLLQNEIARRDTALASMARSGRISVAIVSDKVERAQYAVRTEIDHTKAFISEQIHETGRLVSSNIDHAGETVTRQIEVIQSNLNPAKLIREHPLGATFGAVLAGIVIVPLIKSITDTQRGEQPAAKSFPSSNGGGGGAQNGARESRWKPVTDALLENLPALIAAFMRRNDEPSAAAQQLCAERNAR